MDEIKGKVLDYAGKIKAVDPTALVGIAMSQNNRNAVETILSCVARGPRCVVAAMLTVHHVGHSLLVPASGVGSPPRPRHRTAHIC